VGFEGRSHFFGVVVSENRGEPHPILALAVGRDAFGEFPADAAPVSSLRVPVE